MDSSIPALVIGAILLLGATVLARSSIITYDRLGQQIKEVEARAGEQVRTRLTIVDATLDGPRDTMTVQVRNDGQTRIATWPALDVIVSYTPSGSSQTAQWLAYAPAVPAANEWALTSIAQDYFEPGILNPGETATITVELNPAAATGPAFQVSVTAENGVSATALFTN
jgi:hypothetical protein